VPLFGLLPTLLIFLAVNLGPSLATFVFSFTDYKGIPGSEWRFIGLQNYIDFFTASNARDKWHSTKLTFIFSLSVTVIQNAIGVFLAVLLNGRIRGKTFYRTVIFMPVVLGVTVVGLTWTLIFNPIYGPAIKVLNWFNMNSAFFGDPDLAMPLVIFIQIWANLGYSLVIFLAGLQAIPDDLYEAGYMDGASAMQTFRYVTWPLLSPVVTVNVLLAIIGSLQTFELIYVLTSGENDYTRTLGMLIFQTAFGGGSGNLIQQNQGYASMLSVVLFVFVFIVTVIMQYYLRRREVQT